MGRWVKNILSNKKMQEYCYAKKDVKCPKQGEYSRRGICLSCEHCPKIIWFGCGIPAGIGD